MLTGGLDKIDRIIKKLQRVVENGFWYFNRATCAPICKALAEIPHADPIDLVDAMSYTDDVIQRPETPSESELRERYQHRQSMKLGVTGYGEFMEAEGG